MNVREFHYVCTIHEEGSITRAAAKLFLAQPSLSKYINNLEDSYGLPIFDRSTSPWGLTDFGREYLKTAREALKLERSLEMKMHDLQTWQTGRLALGIPGTRAALLLPDLIPAFTRTYPGIDLQVVERSSVELEEMLLRGTLDLCIYYQYGQRPMLEYKRFAEEKIYLLIPENIQRKYSALIPDPSSGPDAFKDILTLLKEENFYLLQARQHIRKLSDTILADYGVSPCIRTCSNQLEVVARVCSAGMGMTFITHTMKTMLENNSAVPKALFIDLPDRYNIPVVAVIRRDAYLSSPQKEIIRLAAEIYAQY